MHRPRHAALVRRGNTLFYYSDTFPAASIQLNFRACWLDATRDCVGQSVWHLPDAEKDEMRPCSYAALSKGNWGLESRFQILIESAPSNAFAYGNNQELRPQPQRGLGCFAHAV